MRIDVIVNTTARRHVRTPSLFLSMQRLCGRTASIYPTRSVAELDDTTRAIAARGSDLVVLSGGDGSFMAGVTALARAFGDKPLPALAFLPGGTVATLSRNWGTSGDPVALLRQILDLRRAAVTVVRPTLRVVAETPGAVEERIGFMFGTGLVARFFELYYSQGGRGYAGAARIVTRVFAESFYDGPLARRVLDPLPCSIEVEGESLPAPAWSLVCAAVVRDLGIHMQVTYRAGEDPERIHLVASSLLPRELGPRAPRVLAGKRIGGAGHFDDLVRSFAVRFPGPAEELGPYVLDGDMLRAKVVRVCKGPPIRVVDLRATAPTG